MSILNINVLSCVFVWRDSRKRSGLDVVLHSDQSSLSHKRILFVTTLHERHRTSSSHWVSWIIGSFILDQWYDQSTLDMSLNRAFSLSCIWRVSLSISMSYWYACMTESSSWQVEIEQYFWIDPSWQIPVSLFKWRRINLHLMYRVATRENRFWLHLCFSSRDSYTRRRQIYRRHV